MVWVEGGELAFRSAPAQVVFAYAASGSRPPPPTAAAVTVTVTINGTYRPPEGGDD